MRVLCVGVKPNLLEMVNVALQLRWPEAKLLEAVQARRGLEMIATESPDLVILQLGPESEMSLTDTIRELRQFSEVPLIVWEHDESRAEVAWALELGADDFIESSCGFTELVAHMVAIMRRFRVAPEWA